jgi:hypothetical protein
VRPYRGSYHPGPRNEVDVKKPDSHGPPPDRGSGLTGSAIAKYVLILLIVIVALWSVATYLLSD